MIKRVFAFGCSFTEFGWPTWSDIIGNSFNQHGYDYYNFGNSGSGNYYILSSLFLADKKYKFTDRDIIMVMWTSWNREDRYMMEYHWNPALRGQWTKEGNILSAMYDSRTFTEDFARYWSIENDIIKNISSIEIANKLYNINFQSQIPSYESAPSDSRWSKDSDLGDRIYREYINLDAQTNSWKKTFDKYNGLTPDEYRVEDYVKTVAKRDGHPVPAAHMDFVKHAAPSINGLETVTQETESYIGAFSDRMRIWIQKLGWDLAIPKIMEKHHTEQPDYCAGVYENLWNNEWPLELLESFTRPEIK